MLHWSLCLRNKIETNEMIADIQQEFRRSAQKICFWERFDEKCLSSCRDLCLLFADIGILAKTSTV